MGFLEFKGREESLVRQCVDLLRKEKRLHNIAWGHFEDDGVNALLTRAEPDVPLVFTASRTKRLFMLFFLGLLPFCPRALLPARCLWVPRSMAGVNFFAVLPLLMRHMSKRGDMVIGTDYESGALDTASDFRAAFAAGCNTISTNHPSALVAFLQQRASS